MHLIKAGLLFWLLITYNWVFAQPISELKAAEYFHKIQQDPEKLSEFLLAMPKGGDLHIHLTGSSYAENLLRYAHGDNLCINLKNYVVSSDPNCSSSNLLD